jgi:uncharacterized SAM-binding protein YcdF (DUF218 family)
MTLFRRPRLRRLAVALLVAFLLGAYLARGWLLPPVAYFLDVSEPPRPVDAVLVLGGGADDRPFVAAALVRAGLARRVLVSSVQLSPENEDGLVPPEHEVTRRALLARGVPAEDIVLLPGACGSTQDEARALAHFLDAEPDTRVAVVTHGLHTRRARRLFRRVLGGRSGQVMFVAAPCDRFSADDWWRSEDGFSAYATEYLKLITSDLR